MHSSFDFIMHWVFGLTVKTAVFLVLISHHFHVNITEIALVTQARGF